MLAVVKPRELAVYWQLEGAPYLTRWGATSRRSLDLTDPRRSLSPPLSPEGDFVPLPAVVTRLRRAPPCLPLRQGLRGRSPRSNIAYKYLPVALAALAHRLVHFPLRFSLAEGGALVVELFAAREPDLELRAS